MNILQSASRIFHPVSTEVLSDFSVGHASQEPLAQLASELEDQAFTTYPELVRSLRRHQEALRLTQTSDQFLLFSSVTQEQASRLSDDRSQTSKFCRFSFNTKMGTLIAKVIPYPAHQTAIRLFDFLIMSELQALKIDDEVLPLGSTTVDIGNWTKDAD